MGAPPRVAIIGAGAAGAACAWRLRCRAAAAEVVVLEMGRGAGGRSGTRRAGSVAVDHGSPLLELTLGDAAVDALARECERQGCLERFRGRGGVLPGPLLADTR